MPVLAHAPGYLRVNQRTGAADIVNGAQVDWVLTEEYDDQQVKQVEGGGFVVTATDWNVIRYIPLHKDQRVLGELADSYEHQAAPGDGKRFYLQKTMGGKELKARLVQAPGTFCRTRVGEIAYLEKGRVRDIFRPAAQFAQAA
ncbi:hypothetical protein [Streptomyces sp. NPDC088752]|uniref:hypothetical protein n=1 Tax=Streptomyces sp. NPDC088752 TaxID=3154963 RepID=UPI00343A4F7D